MKVAVSGASGFIGSRLVEQLMNVGIDVDILSRKYSSDSLCGVDVVVNLVGRAHVLTEKSKNSFKEYQSINCEYAIDLFKKSSIAKVKLFVQISSIGVLGNKTHGKPFDEKSPVAPCEEYAQSKADAEKRLHFLAEKSATGLCIIRPPLVYGRGAKGNIKLLAGLSSKKILPLPLGSLKNKRDLVSIHNLCDLIITCILNTKLSVGKIFLVSDEETLSSIDLLRLMTEVNGNSILLFRFPIYVLRVFSLLAGKLTVFDKFCSDLEINIGYTKQQLSWHPPYSVRESLSKDRKRG